MYCEGCAKLMKHENHELEVLESRPQWESNPSLRRAEPMTSQVSLASSSSFKRNYQPLAHPA